VLDDEPGDDGRSDDAAKGIERSGRRPTSSHRSAREGTPTTSQCHPVVMAAVGGRRGEPAGRSARSSADGRSA
jgi:hypothetical protein